MDINKWISWHNVVFLNFKYFSDLLIYFFISLICLILYWLIYLFIHYLFFFFSIFSIQMFFNFCVSEYVCLPATLLRSLYLLSVFTIIVSFDFVIKPLFSSVITHHYFYFIFSSIHWGRIQERHSLPRLLCCVGKSFKVIINYFVLFVCKG